LSRQLQIIQYALAAIGVIGVTVSIFNKDITGMIESFVIIAMAVMASFLSSYVRKKQGTKNKS